MTEGVYKYAAPFPQIDDEPNRPMPSIDIVSGDKYNKVVEENEKLKKELDEYKERYKEDIEKKRKRGAYWLSEEGRAELKASFKDANDGNAVRPLLNYIEFLESMRDKE